MKHFVEDETTFENGVCVYKHYYCQRCGKRIRWYYTHERFGIPEYHIGHNPNSGFKQGNTVNIGRHHSIQTKRKLSASKIGENNPMFGKQLSKETRLKISENHADFSGKNHPFYGKRHTAETCLKISKSVKAMRRRSHEK